MIWKTDYLNLMEIIKKFQENYRRSPDELTNCNIQRLLQYHLDKCHELLWAEINGGLEEEYQSEVDELTKTINNAIHNPIIVSTGDGRKVELGEDGRWLRYVTQGVEKVAYRELERVKIFDAYKGLPAGSVGTIVHVYPHDLTGHVPAYEVEFAGNRLETILAENLYCEDDPCADSAVSTAEPSTQQIQLQTINNLKKEIENLKSDNAILIQKETDVVNSQEIPGDVLEAMASAMLEPSIGKADAVGNPVRKKVLQRAFDAAYKMGWSLQPVYVTKSLTKDLTVAEVEKLFQDQVIFCCKVMKEIYKVDHSEGFTQWINSAYTTETKSLFLREEPFYIVGEYLGKSIEDINKDHKLFEKYSKMLREKSP